MKLLQELEKQLDGKRELMKSLAHVYNTETEKYKKSEQECGDRIKELEFAIDLLKKNSK